ncbi:hypothetical protein SAMN05216480_10541 [Pustulibacterium marinum]|uniref:Uncharacterized protein n=1 Tax=Pustulibacterium marinum TaxID=1224947 RepID=A0A1I7GKV7_9FLAO|nr:hypothetical protein [Pustulibacterium marinum]SFU49073.1 hypothetical protein SAMN05216480_10541 [Pustulibacterium marinum]
MTTAFNTAKSNPFQLSTQVKNILQEKGFSSLFNWNDYNYFKTKVKAFHKAQAIAEKFIEENQAQNESDLAEYIF